MRQTEIAIGVLSGMFLTGGACLLAQAPAVCGPEGYAVIARRWDAVLGMNWELRQDCTHPEWPARLVATGKAVSRADGVKAMEALRQVEAMPTVQPLLVHAGDEVRVWMQDAAVRIEMRGVAEESGRRGERMTVRIRRSSEDDGVIYEHLAGVVRGAGDVEMDR